MPDPIGDRDPGAQHAIRGLDLADRDAGRAIDGLVDDGPLRIEQRIDSEIAHHRIGPAHAQNVWELPRHSRQEKVQADERMRGEAGALGQIDLLGSRRVLGLRENSCTPGSLRSCCGTNSARVLVGMWQFWQDRACGPAPKGSAPSGRRAGAIVAERPFRIGRLLVDVADLLAQCRIGRCTKYDAKPHISALETFGLCTGWLRIAACMFFFLGSWNCP